MPGFLIRQAGSITVLPPRGRWGIDERLFGKHWEWCLSVKLDRTGTEVGMGIWGLPWRPLELGSREQGACQKGPPVWELLSFAHLGNALLPPPAALCAACRTHAILTSVALSIACSILPCQLWTSGGLRVLPHSSLASNHSSRDLVDVQLLLDVEQLKRTTLCQKNTHAYFLNWLTCFCWRCCLM